MSCPQTYQSPVSLRSDDAFLIDFDYKIKGFNKGAPYNKDQHVFEVQDDIFLKIRGKKYKLDEYHFHIKGEHAIDDKEWAAEIHYVFIELSHFKNVKRSDGPCCRATGGNLLVIGRVIKNDPKVVVDLEKIQVRSPHCYFVYDGGLTAGDVCTPVKWIVGENPLKLSVDSLVDFSKGFRPLQKLQGRLITKN